MTRAEAKLAKNLTKTEMFWIASNGPRELEVNVTYEDGTTNRAATDELFTKASEILEWGGYCTGYGSWMLRKDYQDRGDFNDKSSMYHY